MSAAKVETHDLDHSTVPATETAAEAEARERRHESDSKRRDRRVIVRMGDPELRKFFILSRRVCNVAVVSAFLFMAILIGRHIQDSTLELNRSIFFGVVVAFSAFGFHYLGSSMKSYTENESKARLVIVSEHLFRALFLFVCTGLVLGVAYVITLF